MTGMFTVCLFISPDLDGNRGTRKKDRLNGHSGSPQWLFGLAQFARARLAMALFLEATFVSEDGKKVLGVCQATGAPGKQVPFKLSAMPGERTKVNVSKRRKNRIARSLARERFSCQAARL
jgi:hypothetical protein